MIHTGSDHQRCHSQKLADLTEELKLREKGLLFDEVINALSEKDVDTSLTMKDWCEILDLELARMLHERVRVGIGWPPQGKVLGMRRSRAVLAQTTPFPP